jgi:hypothetical protein
MMLGLKGQVKIEVSGRWIASQRESDEVVMRTPFPTGGA